MTARNVASGFKCLVRSALAWTIASALIALIGLCFIAWDHFSPKKKELSYAVATTPLIANVEGKPSALHIYYKSEEVSDVQSVQVFVRNTGDIPIRASDFDEPLTVAIAPGHLLDAHITSSFPANLPAAAKPSVSAASVSVAPLLLNPGDQFTVALIVGGSAPHISLNARIVGVEAIRLAPNLVPGTPGPTENSLWLIVVFFSTGVGVAVIFGRRLDKRADQLHAELLTFQNEFERASSKLMRLEGDERALTDIEDRLNAQRPERSEV